MLKTFGWELLLDLESCDVIMFTRKHIKRFLVALCDEIQMERDDLHFWDYEGVAEEDLPTEKHLRGTSAVQFITTSNIVIHALDLTGNLLLNCFSCKGFDPDKVESFTVAFFGGTVINSHYIERMWS